MATVTLSPREKTIINNSKSHIHTWGDFADGIVEKFEMAKEDAIDKGNRWMELTAGQWGDKAPHWTGNLKRSISTEHTAEGNNEVFTVYVNLEDLEAGDPRHRGIDYVPYANLTATSGIGPHFVEAWYEMGNINRAALFGGKK